MERVGQLLEALMERHRKGAGKDELLSLVSELQAALAGHSISIPSMPATTSGKVSIIMPFIPASVGEEPAKSPVFSTPVEEERIIQVLQVDEQELEAELEELRRSAELKNELSIKVRQARVEFEDPLDEIPTLASHRDYLPKAPLTAGPPNPIMPDPSPIPESPLQAASEGRDLNEVIGRSGESLNERLRAVQSELSERLQDSPVKDLRKAIGINDRYLYINQLFQGNESMFDRSLKTLNSFAAYSEAEYWMHRELRIKLGWRDDNVLVQQFLQILRRRFS